MIAAVVFCVSIAVLGYVLLGYPLLLMLWARISPREIKKTSSERSVSVIVPVRNGARWVEAKIRSLLASNYRPDLIDVLIVSDGSTDATEDLIRGFPDSRVRLLALPSGGKATAVTAGLQHVSGEIIVLTDVRQEFDPDAIRELVACFGDASVGVATGELVIRSGVTSEEYNTGLYWRYEKWIRRNLNRMNVMLGATGSIYAIRRELISPIPRDILLDDVYLPFAVAQRGFRIHFESRARAYDVPTSLQSEFWRKVRTQAGVYQILFHFPALLSPANPRFIHFLSHKLGRLLLPFCLIAAAVSSFCLPGFWRPLALTTQGVSYGLALIDPLIPEQFPLKRFSAAARAFVVLISAALCAIVVFFRPAEELWKETRVTVEPETRSTEDAHGEVG
ncbi:MAG: glycosyltransferase [Acidobacteriaceae bacterium]|nr:glycosyltransferase [Acidobacteriaceae bacterium]